MSEINDSSILSKEKPALIHPSSDVDSKATINNGVVISSGAVIGPEVIIGEDTYIGPNVIIQGKVKIGKGNRVFPGACIGLEPQDLKYKGASTEVIIGNFNTIRECVTINRATYENEQTKIGNENLLMAYCHLGHNCHLGNRIVISNSVQVAGHVFINDRAVIGGCLGIHQFVHIGSLAMIGGMTRVDRDVPPFCLAEGHPGKLRGLNLVGIKRSGLDEKEPDEFNQLKRIWKLLFKSEYAISKALLIAREEKLMTSSDRLCEFIEGSISKGRRGVMPYKDLSN